VNVPQSVLNTLAARDIHTHQSRHVFFSELTLTLLVAGIRADNTHDTFAPHNTALLTDAFNRTTNFHGLFLYK
jgi:hypothetical protein